MTSILFVIVRVFHNQFNAIIWKTKKNYHFFVVFLKLAPSFENFEKKNMILISYVFMNVHNAKNVVRQKSKKTPVTT